MTDDDVDEAKHARVAKALEQVNGMIHRYRPALSSQKKQALQFSSDEESSDERGSNDSDCSQDDGQDDFDEGSLDEHIEHILQRTRTIALLRIANNTAKVINEEEFEDESFDEDEFDDIPEEDDDLEQDVECVADVDLAIDVKPLHSLSGQVSMRSDKQKSFREVRASNASRAFAERAVSRGSTVSLWTKNKQAQCVSCGH